MGKKNKPLVIVPLDDFRLNEQNCEEHAEYLKKAEAGDIKAWEEAGMDFLLGLGVERDTGRAYECFQKGGATAEAWEHIGGCYAHGIGCEKTWQGRLTVTARPRIWAMRTPKPCCARLRIDSGG